jgi:hypothetical protein
MLEPFEFVLPLADFEAAPLSLDLVLGRILERQSFFGGGGDAGSY